MLRNLFLRHRGWLLIGLGLAVAVAALGPLMFRPSPAAPARPVAGALRPVPSQLPLRLSWQRPRLAPGTLLGQLQIPDLGWRGDLREGTDESVMIGGPGHDPGSAYPGEADNVVVLARRNQIADLTRLHAGQQLRVVTSYGSYSYTVSRTGTFSQSDPNSLDRSQAPVLTVATSLGAADRFFEVQATLVPSTPDQREQLEQEVAIAQAQARGAAEEGQFTSLAVPVEGVLSQGFGPTSFELELPYIYQGNWYPHFHTGLDFAANQGTAVRSAAGGEVVLAASSIENGQLVGYGNYIVVKHANGYLTLYGHLSAFNVALGAHVRAGQVIGQVGSTGRSTGPHLHFELRRGRDVLDPTPYLGRL